MKSSDKSIPGPSLFTIPLACEGYCVSVPQSIVISVQSRSNPYDANSTIWIHLDSVDSMNALV